MDSAIARAVKRLGLARAALVKTCLEVQKTCRHPVVAQVDWKSGKWFGPMNARRICMHCRLEEEGSHWSGESVWSRNDHQPANLGNDTGREIKKIDSRDDFYRLRVGEMPVDSEPGSED